MLFPDTAQFFAKKVHNFTVLFRVSAKSMIKIINNDGAYVKNNRLR